MSEQLNDTGQSNPAHERINNYALACLVKANVPLNSARLRDFAASLMQKLCSACIERGAKDVGHIKAYMQHDGGYLYADVVGEPSSVKVEGRDGGLVSRFSLTLNCVVFGLTPRELRETTEQALENVLLDFALHKKQLPLETLNEFKGETK